MTLGDKIAETISIKFDHQIEPDDYVDEIADVILNLTEFKEMQEKAALYDEVPHLKDIFMRWKQGRDLILEGLIMEEKCEHEEHYNQFVKKCSKCHGTGTITRPATPEEVREMIEIAFKFSDSHWMHDNVNHAWGYQLKPGAVLRLEVKKT